MPSTCLRVCDASECEVGFSLHRHPVLLYQTSSHTTERHIYKTFTLLVSVLHGTCRSLSTHEATQICTRPGLLYTFIIICENTQDQFLGGSQSPWDFQYSSLLALSNIREYKKNHLNYRTLLGMNTELSHGQLEWHDSLAGSKIQIFF